MAPPASLAAPIIYIFALEHSDHGYIFEEVYSRLLSELAKKAVLKKAHSNEEALTLLNEERNPKAIFVVDAGIADPKNSNVSDRVVDFARHGGIVVLGGIFSSFMSPSDLSDHFSKSWNLPWGPGDYTRSTVSLNRAIEGLPITNLPPSYSQKALFLVEVDHKAACYWPTERSTSQTPIAFTKVGQGWLGYIGDVNAEEETDDVVLGMFGLL